MSDPSDDILTIEQIVSIVGKINNSIWDCDLFGQNYVGLTIYPDESRFPYMEISFRDNIVWDSENYKYDEKTIKSSVFKEIKLLCNDLNIVVKNLDL